LNNEETLVILLRVFVVMNIEFLSYCLHDFAVGHLDETSFLNATDIPDTVLRNLQKGGTYKPLDCLPRERTAIIIPYRDKEKTLKVS